MDKIKNVILIYIAIGIILAFLGALAIYKVSGAIGESSSIFTYLLIAISIFIVFIGLHWVVIGIISLRFA